MGTFLSCREGAAGARSCRQDECNAQPHSLRLKGNVSGKIILLLAVKWEKNNLQSLRQKERFTATALK